ncbi:MAG TPA: glycosyltransferase family 4 protein [Candidatus Thermoplasmatota archaeon]|nr:glycosyltransferase family 4 protein [Candidatus Thermoplasmatota archaeon]
MHREAGGKGEEKEAGQGEGQGEGSPGPLRVAALTRGRDTPSARFRVRQYVPLLAAHGIDVREHAPRRPAHRTLGRGRPGAYLQALATRGAAIAATRRADVTWLQRELVSTRRTLEAWTRAPRVFDVDDAVFLKREGAAAAEIARIAQGCRIVLAGNRFLADWFRQWCDDVRIVPTTIDTQRFTPAPLPPAADAPLVVGWIGTHANIHNLEAIQAGVAQALAAHPGARLRVVAERPPRLEQVPADRWGFVPWSAATEVDLLRSFDVGLMPLEDTPWNRGKCGFKLLQYLAVGCPAVASPVGVNADLLGAGEVGVGAGTQEEWAEALARLLGDATARHRMGRAGRALVERSYSAQGVAPAIAKALRDATR